MTDLPRFQSGSVGKLDFSHLNEVMRRLDLLLPLVQSAAAGGGASVLERPSVFPVYAVPTADDIAGAFDWWEVSVIDGDPVPVATHDSPDDPNARRGGSVSRQDGLDDYGILLDASAAWSGGYALCVVVRGLSGRAEYVLLPLDAGLQTVVVRIIADRGLRSVDIYDADGTPGGSRSVRAYEVDAFAGFAGGLRRIEAVKQAIAYDLNDDTHPNEPEIVTDDEPPALVPRTFDPGTMFLARVLGPDEYAFGQLVRFDVYCDPSQAP